MGRAVRAIAACFVVAATALVAAQDDASSGDGELPQEHPQMALAQVKQVLDKEFAGKPWVELHRYDFAYKNGVLPEHCDLIYYGHCRSTLQCNICDKNRKKLSSAFPERDDVTDYPETYCQKMPDSGHLPGDLKTCGKHGTGCCVPCKRCSTYSNFKDHRLAWEGSVDTVDCRVPRVCPHALDDLDEKHTNKIETMQEQIATLTKGLNDKSLTDDERKQLLKEAGEIQASIDKQQGREKSDPKVLNEELKSLKEDREDLQDYRKKMFAAGCRNGTWNGTGTEVDCQTFKQYQAGLARDKFTSNTKKYNATLVDQIKDKHGNTNMTKSLDKLFNLLGNTRKALNESITDLKEDLEDERGETNKMKSTYTKLEEEISALLSQQKQQQQQEKTASGSKGVSMETIAAIATMLLLFALTIIIVLVFRNRNSNETDEQRESATSLLYEEGASAGGEQDDFQKSMKTLIETESKDDTDYASHGAVPAATVRVKPAKAEKMQAWDNYDEDESMRLSEGHLGEPASIFPMTDPVMSGYNEDDLNGQLGYVTREFDPPSLRNARGMPSRKIASETFVNETGC